MPNTQELKAESIFFYAEAYAKKAENAGRGTRWPTLRETARHFRTRIGVIEEVINDCGELNGVHDYYFGLATAIGIPGVGYANLTTKGSWLIEAYRS